MAAKKQGTAKPVDIDSEQTEQTCPSCGMPRSEWTDTAGYAEGSKTYCCEGCAAGTGCLC